MECQSDSEATPGSGAADDLRGAGGLLAPCPPRRGLKPAAPARSKKARRSPTLPFDRQGMWIWYVSHSEGGSLPAIIARAKRHGIGTVYIKSGDGATVWSQFNKSLVGELHRGGLDVCAWQFVYGDHPAAEAKVGATAVARGADCLVIDAEGDYEGKYAAADPYIRQLRASDRRQLPALARRLPLRRLPPVLPLLGLLRARRRDRQPAADVLEDDRHLGPHGLRAHLPVQPHLGTPDLPARPDLRRRRRRASCSSSAASRPATAACSRAGGTGRRRPAPSGARCSPARSQAGRRLPHRTHRAAAEATAPAATWSSGRRSG